MRLAAETGAKTNEQDRLVAGGIAGLYDLHQGKAADALAAFQNCAPVFDEMGNYHSLGEAQQMMAVAHRVRGEFDEALAIGTDAYGRAKERDDLSLQFSLHMTVSNLVLQRHGFEPDIFPDLRLLFDSEALEARFGKVFTENAVQRAYYHVTRGLAHAQIAQSERAQYHLGRSITALEGEELQRIFRFPDLYVGLAELCEMLHFREAATAEVKTHYETANKLLMRYAKIFIPSQSAAALHTGWLAHHSGADDALTSIRTALSHAQTYQQPYDEMQAHLAIASVTGDGEAAQRAQELAESLKAQPTIRRLSTLEANSA